VSSKSEERALTVTRSISTSKDEKKEKATTKKHKQKPLLLPPSQCLPEDLQTTAGPQQGFRKGRPFPHSLGQKF
jgi:hypothetical protein